MRFQNALFAALFTLVISMSIAPTGAEIFKWKDANGRIHYSDHAPAEKETQSVEQVLLSPINSYERVEISVIDANFSNNPKQRGKRVVMYSTERCGYCKKARAYFKANNIAFTEYDIEKSKTARREFDRLKGTGVPIILIDRKSVV